MHLKSEKLLSSTTERKSLVCQPAMVMLNPSTSCSASSDGHTAARTSPSKFQPVERRAPRLRTARRCVSPASVVSPGCSWAVQVAGSSFGTSPSGKKCSRIMNSEATESSIVSEGVLENSIYQFGTGDVEMFLKSEQFGVGECLHREATLCVGSSQEISNTVLFEDLPDSTQQNIVMSIISPVSTSTHPSMVNYPGPYSFDVQLNKSAGDKAKWEHSTKLNKLFVVMDAKIPFWFKVKPVEPGLLVRILPIFLAQDYFAEPVKRCPTHISSIEKSNQDFFYVDHIVRCHHQGVRYQKDPESQRLSVIVPAEPPQPGCDWFTVMCSFMCKNSCILGMNRRSTALIFTLERETGEVVGRKLLNVRICSCPRRDMTKEESDLSKKRTETKGQIMKIKSSDKKVLVKKPTKLLSNELVKLPVPRKFLKPLREILLVHKLYRDLTEEEKIFLDDINKHLL